MTVQPLVCRWGVLGNGPSANKFVEDLKASAVQSKGSALPIQHRITALATSSHDTSSAFLEIHYPSATSPSNCKHTDQPPSVLSMTAELLASTIVDAVIIDSHPTQQHGDAEMALRSGKAVLLVKPLCMSADEARHLVEVAKSTKCWLGILVKETKKDKASLRWVADECARCRERLISESPQTSWEENIAFLEILDELRSHGTIIKTASDSSAGPSSSQPGSASTSSTAISHGMEMDTPERKSKVGLEEIDLMPRKFPKTPHPGPSMVVEIIETPATDTPPESTELETESNAVRYTNGSVKLISESPSTVVSPSVHLMASNGDSPSVSSEHKTAAALRAQVHELKHLLRQKNAHIAALETDDAQHDGTLSTGLKQSKASVRVSMPPRAYSDKPYTGGIPPPTRSTRHRTSSSVSNPSSPQPMKSTRPPSVNGQPVRRRKEASMGSQPSGENRRPSSRASSIASTAGPDHESGVTPSAGFLAPTLASERRRLASLNDQVSAIARRAVSGDVATLSSVDTEKGHSHANKLILQLNNELQLARGQLETTKTQSSISQRNLASLQKAYDSTKESLHKARVEADRNVTALARQERQHAETLERARRAEAEAKELGRASREWGTRVRQVESELGEVRRAQAHAEAGYTAISSAWKKTRTHWEEEVKDLRLQLQKVIKEHRDQARSALSKFEAVEEEWKGREGEKKGLEAVLEGLRVEREKARVQVAGTVEGLVDRLAGHEEEREGQDRKVQEVREELQRLLRFMREGVTDPEKIKAEVLIK